MMDHPKYESTEGLIAPLYTYNDALLQYLAGDSLHYYMNGDDLLAKFTIGGHNVCVEEDAYAAHARSGYRAGASARTTLRLVAYYDNYMIKPLEISFQMNEHETSVGVESHYSSFRNRNFLYEPETFDIIKEELVIRLDKLRKYRLLYDVMSEFGFEYVGSNYCNNTYLFDGVPYMVDLGWHSSTFRFESCGIYVNHIGPGCPTMFRKSFYDVWTGKDKVLWKNFHKERSFHKFLRLHGSISRKTIIGKLAEIVESHHVDLMYGQMWYDERHRDYVKLTVDS